MIKKSTCDGAALETEILSALFVFPWLVAEGETIWGGRTAHTFIQRFIEKTKLTQASLQKWTR